MAQLTVPINVNLPENWIDLVIERVKQDGDYVLVTRCKDCKHYSFCKDQGCKEDDFCSYAERRTDEQT